MLGVDADGMPLCVRGALGWQERQRRRVRRADGRGGGGVAQGGMAARRIPEDAATPGAPDAAGRFDLGQNKDERNTQW